MRSVVIGFSASIVSDTCSNSFRVLKISKQTSGSKESYFEIAHDIIKQDGMRGLFGRELKMKILTNGIQGIVFNVIWKIIQDL